jgi:hypothetical protein
MIECCDDDSIEKSPTPMQPFMLNIKEEIEEEEKKQMEN